MFQENDSIDHTLVSLTEAIRNTLDNKRFGFCIFIDLQNAFDKVNHKILLSKLDIILFVDVPFSGLDHIYLIESNNMLLLMEVILTYFQLLVVYHKVLYWVHYFSSSTSTIYQMLLRDLLFISLLMTRKSTINPKIHRVSQV